jgi:hypothetical protein
MGFIDKAKQMAEQAQQKLDEAQKQFNQGQSAQGGQPDASKSVRYDEHGRPIEDPPAAAAPPPSAEPVDPPPATDEAARGDTNANPDPFKPIQ